MKSSDKDLISAFQVKAPGQILHLVDQRKPNHSVSEKAGIESHQLKEIMKRKLSCFGHIMRETDWRKK